jgi:hypothetical protein
MNRTLLGAGAAIALLLGGFLVWQGVSRAPETIAEGLPPPSDEAPGTPVGLPEGDPDARGAPPPELPRATQVSREQRRFNRFDRDRNGIITRIEMLSTRTSAFRRLDRDGNNLLSFEEWAVATSDRFAGADRDRSGGLTSTEFATTAPPERRRSECRC